MTRDRQLTAVNNLVTNRHFCLKQQSIFLTKRGFGCLNVDGIGESTDIKHKKWDKVLQFENGNMYVKQC